MGERGEGCMWLRYGKLRQGFHFRSPACYLFLEVLCHKRFRPESSSKVAASCGGDVDTGVSEDFLGSIMVVGFDNQPRFGGADVVPEVRSTGSQAIPPRFQACELASWRGIISKPHLFGGWCLGLSLAKALLRLHTSPWQVGPLALFLLVIWWSHLQCVNQQPSGRYWLRSFLWRGRACWHWRAQPAGSSCWRRCVRRQEGWPRFRRQWRCPSWREWLLLWDKCEDAFFSANERSKGEGKGKEEEGKSSLSFSLRPFVCAKKRIFAFIPLTILSVRAWCTMATVTGSPSEAG